MPARWLPADDRGVPGDRGKMRFQAKVQEDVEAKDLGIDPMDLNAGDESDSSGINDSNEESEEEEWDGFANSDENEGDG